MTDDFKIKVISDTSKAESDIDKLVKKYENKKVKLKIDAGKDAAASLQNAGSAADSLNNSMGNITKNTLLAAASYKAFNMATQQLKEAVSEVEELNKALTTVHMTMQDMSGSDLSNLKGQILDMSNQLSTYVKTVADAAQIYSNANESISTIMQKAEPTVLLATAAGTSASTAADTVQGILNQFHLADEAAMGVVDTLEGLSAEMKMDFALGIDNVAQAVKVSGSVIEDAGMSFEKYASIVSATAESTRQSGSVLGNAFKTIASRIGRSKDGETTDAEKSKAEEAFNSVGVSVRDANGDIRDFGETLDELYMVWGNLNRAQKNYVAEQGAGVRQISIFKNMMDNYSRSLELEKVALNSSGMAMQVNETRAESIDGKMQKLSATMTKLYNDAVSEEAVMSVLDFADALAVMADKLGLLQGAFAALGTAGIAKGISALASNWQSVVKLFTSPTAAIVAGVGAAVSIYSALKKKQEELRQAAREAGTAWEDNTASLQNHIGTVTELKESLESGTLTEEEAYGVKSQLLDIQTQLIETYGSEAKGIDLVNGNLETQISLIKRLSDEEASRYLNENRSALDEAREAMEEKQHYQISPTGIVNTEESLSGKAIYDIAKKYESQGVNFETIAEGVYSTIYFDGDASKAYEVINNFASDVRGLQDDFGKYDNLINSTLDLTESRFTGSEGHT